MSDAQHDPHPLSAELAQLKAALRAVQAPPADEAELRATFRDGVTLFSSACGTSSTRR